MISSHLRMMVSFDVWVRADIFVTQNCILSILSFHVMITYFSPPFLLNDIDLCSPLDTFFSWPLYSCLHLRLSVEDSRSPKVSCIDMESPLYHGKLTSQHVGWRIGITCNTASHQVVHSLKLFKDDANIAFYE